MLMLITTVARAEVMIVDTFKARNVEVPLTLVKLPAYLSNDSSRHWIQIPIDYRATHESFFLECQSPHWRDIKVLYQVDTTIHTYQHTGAAFDFQTRSLAHKNFLFPLPQHMGKYVVWVGLKDPQVKEFNIMIRSSKDFITYSLAEYFALGMYYGLLTLVAMYNLMLYIRGKLYLHLFYVSYIVGCMCFSFQEDGIAYHFIWPHWPVFNDFVVTYLAKPLFLATFLLYASSFLNLPRVHKSAKLIIVCFEITYVLCYLLSKVWYQWYWVAECVFVAAMLSVYITSVYLLRQGNVFAKYFFIGFSVVLASMLVNLFRHIGWIGSTLFTVYSYNFSILFEVILFSWALAERIRSIQEERKKNHEELIVQFHKNDELQRSLIESLDEKRKLQDKVNRELEQKVKDRTEELESANEKLKAFAQKMDHMNAALDLDNHQLKKEIKNEKISRVFHEELSFEEFCKLYPHEDACLKEIYDMKWATGYKCKKCGNDKHSGAIDWHRKKCSKCGYIESTTSHTLYHHLKFPLNKAFYITYVEVAGLHFTNDALSGIIDLRKPTVWAFKQKVFERTLDKKYKKNKSWKDMILDKI